MRFTAVHGMKRERISSRKFSKFVRNDSLLASATTSDSAAVNEIVATRTESVGRTLRNESTALIAVSDPPWRFSAVTEISPSAAKSSTIVPKPSKIPFAAASIDFTVSNASPADEASSAPSPMSHAAPRPEPQYVHQNVLRTVTSGGRYRE